MPLENWMLCHDGKIENVRVNKRGNDKLDLIYWTKLQDEYLKKFGLSETYSKLLKVQVLKAQKELDYVITGNRKILNDINIQEAKLVSLMASKGEDLDVEDVLIYLSKFLGYKVNKKTITVTEYFKSIDIYQKANKNGTTNKEE